MSLWPPVVDAISVARGYEAALGAALGDDLDASTDDSAPAHWSLLQPSAEDPALPAGVEALATRVSAPPALARRLAQIGVVTREEGKRLSALLKAGQRLVSAQGDLWRWDGFVAAAEAPTPAARRLVEKNRLGDLEREAEAARQALEGVRAEAGRAAQALRAAEGAEQRCAHRRPRRARRAGRRARGARRFRARARSGPLAPRRDRRGGVARARPLATKRPNARAEPKRRSPNSRRPTNWRSPWSARARSPPS